MKKMKNLLSIVLVLVLVMGLSACGQRAATGTYDRYESYEEQEPVYEPAVTKPAAEEPAVQEPAPEQTATPEPSAETQTQEPVTAETDGDETENADASSTDSATRARIERLLKAQEEAKKNAGNDASQEPAEEPESAMNSVERIAELGNLTGTGQLARYEARDTVDVSDAHNPYDLVWQYGDKNTEKGDSFGKLYASYVDAADWSLVFDAEYYKKAFPMLAMLYHDDDVLLLEHFQTVGVHEGRQGAENFNVSVYMANCDKKLLDAFGDDYECYYFYYMLNHAVEGKVETTGVYGKDPLWLDLELTLAQANELRAVNKYRKDAGADPVVLDPENIAFANYRAWYNAVNAVRGHDWLYDKDNKEVDKVFDITGASKLIENTVTQCGNATAHTSFNTYAIHYKLSKPHYEAMVRPQCAYLGVSHQYYNPDAKWMSQFDTFLYEQPSQDFTMR